MPQLQPDWNRRNFLRFMGRGAALTVAAPIITQIEACVGQRNTAIKELTGIQPSKKDALILARGLDYQVLISWGDIINDNGDTFGFNNDYTAFIPDNHDPNRGILWVNHEYIDAKFVSGYQGPNLKSRTQIDMERKAVGGSILHLEFVDNQWQLQKKENNMRIDATTRIPMVTEDPIAGSLVAEGTLGNCAGGITPWGTVLTCEENTIEYYGDVLFQDNESRKVTESYYGWSRVYPNPPEHYGWVVEVDVATGQAKKLTALGRFAHECATVRQADNGRCVVYSGDDEVDRCLYKFIAEKPGSLEKGVLYVADIHNGVWIPLDIHLQPRLKERFKNQTDMLIRCREAASIVGGTPLDRPEDVEIDPDTGAVIVTLTNNIPKGNYYGSLLRIMEDNNNPLSLSFAAQTMLMGGPEAGFACPDNLVFDKKGNLWITTDITGSQINKGPYEPFGNNGLYYLPMHGPHAGKIYQIASAPVTAELTGPCFSPDGKTLFLSVQHPGEYSARVTAPLSHWPDGGRSHPKPSVVTINGPMMDRLMQ